MANSVTSLDTGDPELAARYLADQLSEQERAEFERRMLSDADLLREVEATARFKAGLARARDRGELAPLLFSSSRMPSFLVAAAVAVLVLAVALWRMPETQTRPWMAASAHQLGGGSLAVPSVGATYNILRLRAQDTADARIELPADRQALEMRVLPDAGGPDSTYTLTLEPAAQSLQPATVGGLPADERGYVTVYLDSSALRAGFYQMRLEEELPDGRVPAGDFRVEFLSEGTGP